MVFAAHKEGDLWVDTLLNLNGLNGRGIFDQIKSHQLNSVVACDDSETALFDFNCSHILQVLIP